MSTVTPLSRKRQSMPSISIREIRLESVIFQVNPHFRENGSQEGLSYRLNVDSHLNEEDNSLLVRLRVNTPGRDETPDYPFFFDLQTAGVFDLSAPVDENTRLQLASINCPAILYPYLRETLADLTRKAGFPPLHLPVTNFIKLARSEGKLVQELVSEKAATSRKSPRKPVERKRKPPTKAK